MSTGTKSSGYGFVRAIIPKNWLSIFIDIIIVSRFIFNPQLISCRVTKSITLIRTSPASTRCSSTRTSSFPSLDNVFGM